ncbi:type II CAAX endopeptidase family protein [Mollicutes bacterium LVI A0039]|nr:type II CAAX endopeptidase family protein [Mollicutes bacterium LVI A0039]
MNKMLDSIEPKFKSPHWTLTVLVYGVAFLMINVGFEFIMMIIASFVVIPDVVYMFTSFIFMSTASFLVIMIFEKSKLNLRFGFETEGIFKKYMLGYGLGALLIVLSAAPIMMFFTSTLEIANPIPYKSILIFFIFFLIQGASEEIYVRGMIFPIIVKYSRPIWGLVLTSGFFSALHLLNPGVNVVSIVNLFLAGVLFGYCVLYFDSLWQACALHSAWNFVQGNVLGFEVSGLSINSLANVQVAGGDLFTGAKFGVEGSIFALIVLGIAIAIFHVLTTRKGINVFAKTIQN